MLRTHRRHRGEADGVGRHRGTRGAGAVTPTSQSAQPSQIPLFDTNSGMERCSASRGGLISSLQSGWTTNLSPERGGIMKRTFKFLIVATAALALAGCASRRLASQG